MLKICFPWIYISCNNMHIWLCPIVFWPLGGMCWELKGMVLLVSNGKPQTDFGANKTLITWMCHMTNNWWLLWGSTTFDENMCGIISTFNRSLIELKEMASLKLNKTWICHMTNDGLANLSTTAHYGITDFLCDMWRWANSN